MLLVGVDPADATVVSFRWMWAPTFIGENINLRLEIDRFLEAYIQNRRSSGYDMTTSSDDLRELHDVVVTFLCEKFEMSGLRNLLEATKFVSEINPMAAEESHVQTG